MAAGVPVTINSDDPPMFSTNLNKEHEVAAGLLKLDEHGVAELARQAVRYSFLDDPGKAAVLSDIDNHLQTFSHRAAATSRIATEPGDHR